MLRQTVTMVGTVLATVVASAVTASADDGWGTVDCDQSATPQCQLGAGSAATPPETAEAPDSPGGTSASADEEHVENCGYQPSGFRPPTVAGQVPPTSWYEGLCSTTGVIQTPVQVATVSPAEVARLARDQLGLPEPGIAASPMGDQLVNLPTWLWLDGGWETRSATASVPGVSVTATARPTSVAWSMGDGHTVTCTGPGTAYRPDTSPRSASPNCGHIYRQSSAAQPDDAFAVTATVRWSVAWSGAGQSGSFPGLTTTSTTRFRVAESQALNIPAPR